MTTKVVKIADLKEIPEFRNFYASQPNEDLRMSLKNDGQLVPVQITEDGYLIDGYRRRDALKADGITEVFAIVKRIKPTLYDRLLMNQYRIKTTDDQIQETKYLFKKYPKLQGIKSSNGERYVRDEMISAGTNGRFKGDKTIKKLEEVIKNDLPGDVLLRGILADGWKVDTCHEFLSCNLKLDKDNKYGYTEKLEKGEINVADANKLIKQMDELSKGVNYTFVIPQKGNAYNRDCMELAKMEETQKSVDLLLTSPPYFILRKYQNEDLTQIGHEKTAKEYCDNVSKIIGNMVPTLKETANVMINIGETYDDGVGYGIPQLLKQSIENFTDLIYKDTLIWSKPNPKPQNENVLRPTNNVEYILWFVVAPNKAKYNLLTYPVEGKEPKFCRGAKDVDKDGKVWDKNLSITKPYGKIFTHLKQQDIEKIIECSIGKNHEVYKICSEGHPAIMSALLPVVPILMTTDEGDTVLDPFAGTNVVGRMTLLLNRKALSAELSNKYFKIGCEMLKQAEKDFDSKSLDFISSIVYQNAGQNLNKAA
jgi:DNA modification methylase